MDRTASQGCSAAPAAQTSFSTVADVFEYANILASRLEAVADQMLGCAPTQGACVNEKIQETPDGVLPRMTFSARYTRNRLSDASNALDRIQQSL